MLKADRPDQIQWSPEGKQAIEALKEELSKAHTLGSPNHKLPFFLFIHENKENALGALNMGAYQKHGDLPRSVGYYSRNLTQYQEGSLSA